MFDFITGKLVKTSQEAVTIETNGIGYRIFVAGSCMNKLPGAPATVRLYISFVIREFSQAFYGFLEEAERELFEALLNISGIGPKTALAIIGYMPPDELSGAIMRKDIQTLCKVPGIGKKTAERLLIELKDTLPLLASMGSIGTISSPLIQDAISALINLGYNQITAQKAVKKAMEARSELSDLPALITLSLKNI